MPAGLLYLSRPNAVGTPGRGHHRSMAGRQDVRRQSPTAYARIEHLCRSALALGQ